MTPSSKAKTAPAAERNGERGFTLIELSIVLVIIGLLVGGVIKGKDLIDNTKVTKFIQEVDALQSAMIAYNSRYSANIYLDHSAGSGTPVTGANIYAFSASNSWDEELEDAGLWSGGATGSYGAITRYNVSVSTLISGLTATSPGAACYATVPYRAAITLDGQLDDGDIATGRIRASYAASPGPETSGSVCVSHGAAF